MKNIKLILRGLIILLVSSILWSGCNNKSDTKTVKPNKDEKKEVHKIKNLNANILREIPHQGDKTYTQGFEIFNGILYESTGLKNESTLKKIDINTGDILHQVDVEGIFAEGLTILNNRITMLSYRRGIALTYNIESLKEEGISFNYKTEGWGLTNDGKYLIMSDGSDKLYYRDPMTKELVKTIHVKYDNMPLYYLNELEYANNKIYANIYGKEFIVSIDPETGKVLEDINASNISCSQMTVHDPEAVLNGIAFNKETSTFYLTGKKCNKIYEVKFQ